MFYTTWGNILWGDFLKNILSVESNRRPTLIPLARITGDRPTI